MTKTVWQTTQDRIREVERENAGYADVRIAREFFGWVIWDAFRRVNYELRGWSVKCSQSGTLLVVKAVVEDRPVVCFVSGISFDDTQRVFFRQWETGTVKWSVDKFA